MEQEKKDIIGSQEVISNLVGYINIFKQNTHFAMQCTYIIIIVY